MKKKPVYVILILIIALGLVSCTSATPAVTDTADTSSDTSTESTEMPSEAVEFPEMTITISTFATDTDPVGQGAAVLEQEIEAATDGKVQVEVYYSNSLFTQDQELEAVLKGNLDMFTGWYDWLVPYMPKLSTITVPFAFGSEEHFNTFFQSEAAQELTEEIAQETGIRMFLPSFYRGARHIFLRTDKKIASRADLANVKLRVPNNETWLNIGEALGANAIGLGYSDVYLALQTGTIDAAENSTVAIKDVGFYEVSKSLTLTSHIMSASNFGMNEELWQSLSPELQQVILDAMVKACAHITETSSMQEAEATAFLEEQGLVVYTLTDEEKAAYRQEVLDAFFANETLSKDVDMELFQAIQDAMK